MDLVFYAWQIVMIMHWNLHTFFFRPVACMVNVKNRLSFSHAVLAHIFTFFKKNTSLFYYFFKGHPCPGYMLLVKQMGNNPWTEFDCHSSYSCGSRWGAKGKFAAQFQCYQKWETNGLLGCTELIWLKSIHFQLLSLFSLTGQNLQMSQGLQGFCIKKGKT